MGFIDTMRAEDHAVESICRILREQGCQIAARTYRNWKQSGRVVADRTVTDAQVVDAVRDIAWTSKMNSNGVLVRKMSPEGLYAPVSVVATWAHRELTDTAYFVSTFAPLAHEPAVQDFIAEQAIEAIETHLDIDQIADDLFSGLEGLDIGPRGQAALSLLQAPAVSGVKGLIESTVTNVVRSDAFAAIWEDTLTLTHTQLVNTATGQQDAAITVGPDQHISVQLGPIIQTVKEQLLADGFSLADRIPEVSRSIVIVQDSSVGTYLAIYHIVDAIGLWLPWIMLLLLAAGVLAAPRRSVSLAWAAGAVLVVMILASKGVDVGGNLVALAAANVVPHDVTVTVYDGILGHVRDMVIVLGVLAGVVMTISLLAGPWRWALTLRGAGSQAMIAMRGIGERHGLTTGTFGRWLYQWRQPLRLLVGGLASAYILFVRPITPEVIVMVAVLSIGTVILLEVLARPPVTSAPREQLVEP